MFEYKMIKMSENRYLLILLVLFPESCFCLQNPPYTCSPSACGNIENISYPFRLKNDPKHCGDPNYELECENNVTTLLKTSHRKYKVKEIDYANHTIRVADHAFAKNTTCSFPALDLSIFYAIYTGGSISLMRCPYPLKNSNSSFFTHCNSSTHTYTFIRVGQLSVSEVRDNCSVETLIATSWNFMDDKNVSVSEIRRALLYGILLNWGKNWEPYCTECNGEVICTRNYGDIVSCSVSLGAYLEALWDRMQYPYFNVFGPGPETFPAVFLIFLLILVVLFAGVTIPAKIILGFIFAAAFIYIKFKTMNTYWPITHLHLIIGMFFAARLIVVFPCIIWFFIHKFRTRHLSRFAAIEDFLQSENNLIPIRYSYSEIRKMTRGFREKLGQGGYGTVYKGKLRSGYDVAVKLLGKHGGNGQDFMNEISTIGRIHHVNVAKLVGYCAERSKRALVFDYMPNGSLDKYLYSKENTNCLSWEKKYNIAIGIARGIEYLHRGCDIQILHFDIKPHNILLDDNFTPKITDFGLAKFFSTDKEVVTMTAVRGTIGYVAPELINRGFGEVSYKADIYSFGMLLMEMVGLNKDLEKNDQASSMYFPCWIYDRFEQGHDIEFGVTDENNDDDNNDTSTEIAKKMTIVALWCIQMSPGDRPSMNKVVEMLESQVERLQVPNRPSQSAHVAVNIGDQSWSTYSSESISLLPHDAAPNFEIIVEDLIITPLF